MKKLTILVLAALLCCMTACDKNEPNGPEFVEAVDLGLSVKWANVNVGATKPEEYGGYFAWGETSPKTDYSWGTYKYCNGSYSTINKYCTDSQYGTIDDKTILELTDDAAHVNWGGRWRMPTEAEQDELVNECTWTWTTQNGVNGCKVTGKNGNSIFLPAVGYRKGIELEHVGSYVDYWSSSLRLGKPSSAHFMRYLSYEFSGTCNRYLGHTVRPVCP